MFVSSLSQWLLPLLSVYVIILYYFGVGATEARSMIIRKMRYTAHEKKSILYDIFNDGIRVVSEEEAYKL